MPAAEDSWIEYQIEEHRHDHLDVALIACQGAVAVFSWADEKQVQHFRDCAICQAHVRHLRDRLPFLVTPVHPMSDRELQDMLDPC